MSYKDILVLLDERSSSKPRMDAAISLSRRFDAHLTGLWIAAEAAIPGFVASQLTNAAQEARRSARQEAIAAAQKDFETACSKAGIRSEWRDAVVLSGDESPTIKRHVRYCDLVIAGQPDLENSTADERQLLEDLLIGCGRPVLVVPSIGVLSDVGQRIMVAWDSGREATRAVADALPLLREAKEVEVVTVDARRSVDAHGEEPGADIARHLVRHDVKTKVAQLKRGPLTIGDLLLNRVADNGYDLIVMGAYAHSRLRELVLGGVTKHMLRHMTVPIFTAH